MLEGERTVTAMAYTILKLHATKLLKFKDMDSITDYLQVNGSNSLPFAFIILSISRSTNSAKTLDIPTITS